MSEAIKESMRFQEDRKLNEKDFDKDAFLLNMLEELLELYGVNDNKERSFTEGMKHIFLDRVKMAKDNPHFNRVDFKEPTDNDEVDAMNDLIQFSIGDIMKKGYNPELTILETSKEINSRVGEFIDGKFIKDKSEEAQENWVIADYDSCKIDSNES